MTSQSEWSEEDIHELIEEYKHRPILWDSRIKVDKFKKLSAWRELANIFNTTVSEVQCKTNFLKRTYDNERKKFTKMTPSKKKKFTPSQYYEELRFIGDPPEYDVSSDESVQSISPPSTIRPGSSRSSVVTEEPSPVSESISRLSSISQRPIKRRRITDTIEPVHVTSYSPTKFVPDLPPVWNVRKSVDVSPYSPTKLSTESSIWNEKKVVTKKVQEELNETVSECGSILSSSFTDQYELFGAFVASEIRNLKHESSKVQLKKMIQRSILQVSDQDSRTPLKW